MQTKIMLLLSQNANQRPGILEPYLASEGQRIRGKLPKGATHLRAFHIAEDPTQQVVHLVDGRETPPVFDAIFEVGAADTGWEDLLPAIKEIPIRLGKILDRNQSAVIVGSEHTIVPGEEPLMLVYPLRRLPDMSSEAFHDYWLNHHGTIARPLPGLQGYRQFHADAGATIAAAQIIGIGISDFEGAAQGYFKNPDDFLAIMSQPKVQEVIEDEKKFIDHSRSTVGLYHVAWKTSV